MSGESECCEPYVIRRRDVERFGARLERGFRIVAPRLRGGERPWSGGVWSEKHVMVSDVFELGVFLPRHRQEFHMHTHSFEIYLFLGEGEVEYLHPVERCVKRVRVYEGDVVIFPPRMYHRVRLHNGMGYTIIVRTDAKHGSLDDKVTVDPDRLRFQRYRSRSKVAKRHVATPANARGADGEPC